MEKDHLRISSHGGLGRDRTGVDGSVSLRGRSEAESTPAEFMLQWGNRKRLRCMKVQVRGWDVSGGAAVVKSTVRVDRRVVRADRDAIRKQNQQRGWIQNHNNESNGYLNLRQRPISPPTPRILRNSEISGAMRGHSNGGVRSITSPEKRPPSNNEEHPTSEITKKGGSSSGSGEAAAIWPPKFVIGLTNKEKEEDFMAIKGSKLPQRPKKRAKIIQRTINLVSPGTWLCDLTLERYEVREKKISKKRPRGLKAIVNMESDSE